MKIQKAIPKQDKFYDLYRDGVTQSFINKFLTCKEQCRLEYVEGWTPKIEPIWFTYGKLIHHVLSKCYAEGSSSNVQKHILDYEKNLPPTLNSTDLQTKEIIFGLAEMIIPIYFSKYPADFKCDVILNEANFRFVFPECAYFDNPIPISGRFDGIFTDPANKNNLWILDTKCLSMIDDDLGAVLPFDTQVMLYCWAARQSNLGCIKGFIYNIIRRPMHRMTQKDKSIKDFCIRVIRDICERMDEFFIRIQIPITDKEIDEWENKFLIPVLCEIDIWYHNGCESYVNPNALITKYGHCGMFDLITKGDSTNYYKRSKPFGELE